MPDKFKPRPIQKRMLTSVINKLDNGDSINVWDVHPGTGKTLGVLAVLNELYRRGEIDAAAIYTPRFNLCTQFETDWNKNMLLFDEPRMGKIVHRSNEKDDLLGGDHFGFVSTYQSLIDLTKHFRAFKKHMGRIALVADEGQILGSETEGTGGGTAAAANIKSLAQAAKVVIVMSGTPYRSDGKELLFGRYSNPNENGVRYLEADVQATYFEGVAEKYLRPFEYELFDGEALYEYLDGDIDNLVVSDLGTGLSKVFEHEGFWQPLVDRTVEQVHSMKRVDKRFCGLIGAANQQHAKSIVAYLKRQGVSCLLAVSDEMAAQDNMRKFKIGNHDVLVTVAMAHVGYDHQPITVVTCLNPYRSFGWLDQFFARGLRIMDDVPLEAQVLKAIVPNDRYMVKYVKDKRAESALGLKERGPGGGGPGPAQERLGQTTMAIVTEIIAMGMDPKGDVSPDMYRYYSEAQKRYNLGPVNLTGLHLFAQELSTAPNGTSETDKKPILAKQHQLTENEKEKILRKEIAGIAKRMAARWMLDYNYFFTQMKTQFGKGLAQCNTPELEGRKTYLLRLEEEQLRETSRNR